ncbi:MAG: methyltransferase domain-containing protein [Methylophilaceae bacterium]
MSEGIVFSDEVNHALKMAYQTPDIIAARAEVISGLVLQQGQKVLDIGSGPGLLVRDIVRSIGPSGSVLGIDLADNMLESASILCSDLSNASFEKGDAMSLPCSDNSFDAVVSTQVYEYVPDLNAALVEFARVLKPGGRGVIVDTDWAFPYWSAVDFDVRDLIIDAWKVHCPQESVPLRLAGAIQASGLTLNQTKVVPITNTSYDETNFSYWLSKIIGAFIKGQPNISEKNIKGWLEGLETLHDKGEYLFCINRYLFEISKPA